MCTASTHRWLIIVISRFQTRTAMPKSDFDFTVKVGWREEKKSSNSDWLIVFPPSSTDCCLSQWSVEHTHETYHCPRSSNRCWTTSTRSGTEKIGEQPSITLIRTEANGEETCFTAHTTSIFVAQSTIGNAQSVDKWSDALSHAPIKFMEWNPIQWSCETIHQLEQ